LLQLPQLRSLILSHNNLTCLTLPDLSVLTNLKILNLSYNLLMDFDPSRCPASLEILYLEGNPWLEREVGYRLKVVWGLKGLAELDEVRISKEERRLAKLSFGGLEARLSEELGEDAEGNGLKETTEEEEEKVAPRLTENSDEAASGKLLVGDEIRFDVVEKPFGDIVDGILNRSKERLSQVRPATHTFH
jgi:hypothetical protein